MTRWHNGRQKQAQWAHQMSDESLLTLTPLQKEFCLELPQAKSAAQAFKKARKKANLPEASQRYCESGASRMLRSDDVKRYLIEQGARYKVTVGRVFQKINQLIDYKSTVIAPTGVVLDVDGRPLKEDNPNVQLKAVELAVKVLPQFSATRQGGGRDEKHLHLHNVNPADIAHLADSGMLPEEE